MLHQIDRVIKIKAPSLDDDQRKRLTEIGDKCPLHVTLTSDVHIMTKAAD